MQRAAAQLGGSAGVTVYVNLGFAPIVHGVSPYLLNSGLVIIGLCLAIFVAQQIPISDGH
ncbi:hypothetical protein ACTXLI_02425 [Glutamicibacter arilaitensis]